MFFWPISSEKGLSPGLEIAADTRDPQISRCRSCVRIYYSDPYAAESCWKFTQERTHAPLLELPTWPSSKVTSDVWPFASHARRLHCTNNQRQQRELGDSRWTESARNRLWKCSTQWENKGEQTKKAGAVHFTWSRGRHKPLRWVLGSDTGKGSYGRATWACGYSVNAMGENLLWRGWFTSSPHLTTFNLLISRLY